MHEPTYELHILFQDHRKPIKLPARSVDLSQLEALAEKKRSGEFEEEKGNRGSGNRTASGPVCICYETLWGERVPIILDPVSIRAVVPVPTGVVDDSRGIGGHEKHQSEKHDVQVVSRDQKGRTYTNVEGDDQIETSEEDERPSSLEHTLWSQRRRDREKLRQKLEGLDKEEAYELGCRDGAEETERRHHRRVREEYRNRDPELEKGILFTLARFGQATVEQLSRPYPLVQRFIDSDSKSEAIRSFFSSVDKAHDRLEAMSLDGLVQIVPTDGYSAVRYAVTQRGAEHAGLPSVPLYGSENFKGPQLARTHDQALRILDLCQTLMQAAGEQAEWVTNLELLDQQARHRREQELQCRLPEPSPGLSKADMPRPDGILISKESHTMVAVLLETTKLSNKRPQRLERLMTDLYNQQTILNSAHLFFSHPEAKERARELTTAFPRSDFFSLHDYRIESPPDLLARNYPRGADSNSVPRNSRPST